MDCPKKSLSTDARGFKRFAATWLFRLGWTYAIALLTLYAFFHHVGERHPLLAAMLYLPPAIWILPGAILSLTLLFFRFKAGIFLSSTFLIFSLYTFEVRWSPKKPKAPHPSVISAPLHVYTYNIGQSGDANQSDFVQRHQPEILAIQEIGLRNRSKLHAAPFHRYPYRMHLGEFALLSQYPILSQKVILGRSGPFAVCYQIHWKGRLISVYSVHLKSPRRALKATQNWRNIGRALKFSLTGKDLDTLTLFWKSQHADLQTLCQRIQNDSLPCIVMGDTNLSSLGSFHRELTTHLTDVHEAVGSGSGYTFPGRSSFLLTGYGPWLRLDRILVNRHFLPQSIEVEPTQASQHRSVAATLTLRPALDQRAFTDEHERNPRLRVASPR